MKTWLACQGSGDGRIGDIGYIHIVFWLVGWVMGKICRYKRRRTISEGAFSGGRRLRIRGDLNFVIGIFFLLSKEVFSGFLDGISILKDVGFILLFTLDGLIELMMDLLASYEKLHMEYCLAGTAHNCYLQSMIALRYTSVNRDLSYLMQRYCSMPS